MPHILTVKGKAHPRLNGMGVGTLQWVVHFYTMDLRGFYEHEPLLEIKVAEENGDQAWIALDQDEVEQLRTALQIAGDIAKEGNE